MYAYTAPADHHTGTNSNNFANTIADANIFGKGASRVSANTSFNIFAYPIADVNTLEKASYCFND